MQVLELARQLESNFQELPLEGLGYQTLDARAERNRHIEKMLAAHASLVPPEQRDRLLAEFNGWGPLHLLREDPSVTEILVLSHDQIWIERDGKLNLFGDRFASELSYKNFLHRLCLQMGKELTKDRPTLNGQLESFRIHIVDKELTQDCAQISLRRQNTSPWSFEKLQASRWASEEQIQMLLRWIQERKNFLVIGPTSSGKTSVLNACLQTLGENERLVVIEDTKEVHLPNRVSSRLLTRKDSQGVLSTIDMTDLLKQSLRMRPDRLVVGEVRGGEAKDLLLALSTGHAGSMGTLHAASPQQALIRLEMLIQMGAANWSLSAIRKLISISLDGILTVGKDSSGQRRFEGLHRIASLEESGFLIEKII